MKGRDQVERQDDGTEFRIGVISDTHGLLRPQVVEQLRGAQHIIHAGDIGNPAVLEAIKALAPATSVRGNIDIAAWAAVLPETQTLRLAGVSIHVLHDLSSLDATTLSAGVDIVISGHSHRPSIVTRKGTLFLNPGSAGPRRFRLPITVASLIIDVGAVRPQIHDLLA